jgi:hypothetical protein
MSIPAGMLREHSHKTVTKRRREVTAGSLHTLQPLAPGALLQRAALAPESLRPAEVVRMQQTLGNRAVGGLLNRSSSPRSLSLIEAKLTVNAPGDEYEQEADRVAEQVMRMPAVQREAHEENDTPEVMTKPFISKIQRQELEDEDSPASTPSQLAQPRLARDPVEAGKTLGVKLPANTHGKALPDDVRARMEKVFQTDFSDVRIHEGSEAESIGVMAYTQGSHIHFRPGEYNPYSLSGQELLRHELTHVVQQLEGRVPAPLGNGVPINDNPLLEEEAIEKGKKAAGQVKVSTARSQHTEERGPLAEVKGTYGTVWQCNGLPSGQDRAGIADTAMNLNELAREWTSWKEATGMSGLSTVGKRKGKGVATRLKNLDATLRIPWQGDRTRYMVIRALLECGELIKEDLKRISDIEAVKIGRKHGEWEYEKKVMGASQLEKKEEEAMARGEKYSGAKGEYLKELRDFGEWARYSGRLLDVLNETNNWFQQSDGHAYYFMRLWSFQPLLPGSK